MRRQQEFCIRIDYLNPKGEQHFTTICGSEALADANDIAGRLNVYATGFEKLGREILSVQKIEHVELGLEGLLPHKVLPRPAVNDGVLRLVKGKQVG
jgi:hypothetical protein